MRFVRGWLRSRARARTRVSAPAPEPPCIFCLGGSGFGRIAYTECCSPCVMWLTKNVYASLADASVVAL